MKYRIIARETRVHECIVEANSIEEAWDLAEDLDGASSIKDSFDDWEVMDVDLED